MNNMENKDQIDLASVFKNNIRIEPKVIAIETLFNNSRRLSKTDYKPPYQRNYVWDDEKATYFIESILLGTEIPPLIFFNSGDKIEVIDGRQRYETIYRFINNKFRLKKKGLHKFSELSNKCFDNLENLKDIIWDTKLRIIEFSFLNSIPNQKNVEDMVKIEIFKRYNSGITPLSTTEIDKAKYIDDTLNSYIKNKLKRDKRLHDLVKNIFIFEKDDIDFLSKQIRQQLVLHHIPIQYYSANNTRSALLNRFYNYFSINNQSEKDIKLIFSSFVKKINLLDDIRKRFEIANVTTNRLIFECLYWSLCILEKEKINLKSFNSNVRDSVVNYISKNLDAYKMEQNSFAAPIMKRYETIAIFFENEFSISFQIYLKTNENFREINYSLENNKRRDAIEQGTFETLRLNKPDASSNAIDDICRQITRQRFLIRPAYQRNEVINKNKSSSIIESILLGIKLPPIFVFKRNNGISEVVDGQQRLLSILGFLGKEYLNENNVLVKSDKDKFNLTLKNGILKDLNGKRFDKLSKEYQDRILDYDLWIIEIDEKNNNGFEPIDLFLRLNYKPYPIKENTFEMWNSYIDRELIEEIKSISERNKEWFFLRKSDKRMENETLLTYIIYLFYKSMPISSTLDDISKYLDIYKIGSKINLRIKSKIDITRVIDTPSNKSLLSDICKIIESDYIQKIEILLSITKDMDKNKKISEFNDLSGSDRRTYQLFYILWVILKNITIDSITRNTLAIKNDIKKILNFMSNANSVEEFKKLITDFWGKYK